MNSPQIGALFLVALIAVQSPAQMKTPMDSAHARLRFLAGRFTTEVTMPPTPMMPKGATGKGSSTIAWGLDSVILLIDEESINSLFGKYSGHGVLGYDANTHEYHLSMFNNFGDHPTYRGMFVGDTLVLRTHVPMPRNPFDQKILWFRDGDAVKLRVLNDAGKGYSLVVEQTALPEPRK